ncbi:hypothetical protein M2368_002678 [Arthrobacter sp. JUb119]|nr:hypothetical protein [Arthrobacter sp. MYb222]MCS3493654.1 hypothetical protein [Arthrobacter sp. JUb119]TDU27314.1 hypothetical protein EDF61_104391 [Arthrobacter sp. JUb115]
MLFPPCITHSAQRLAVAPRPAMPLLGSPAEFYVNFGQPIYP